MSARAAVSRRLDGIASTRRLIVIALSVTIFASLALVNAVPPSGPAAGLAALPGTVFGWVMPPRLAGLAGAAALAAALGTLIVLRLSRDAGPTLSGRLAAALFLTNPLLLAAAGDPNAAALLGALLLFWLAAADLRRRPFHRAGPAAGLALALLLLASPYAVPFVVPSALGLLFLAPRRLIRHDTAGFLLVTLMPLAIAAAGVAYAGIVLDLPLARAIADLRTYHSDGLGHAGTAGHMARFGGLFISSLAYAGIWSLMLAPRLVVRRLTGDRDTRASRTTGLLPLYAAISAGLAFAIAAKAGLGLSPIVPLAALLLATLTDAARESQQPEPGTVTLAWPGLAWSGLAWAGGLLGVALYC